MHEGWIIAEKQEARAAEHLGDSFGKQQTTSRPWLESNTSGSWDPSATVVFRRMANLVSGNHTPPHSTSSAATLHSLWLTRRSCASQKAQKLHWQYHTKWTDVNIIPFFSGEGLEEDHASDMMIKGNKWKPEGRLVYKPRRKMLFSKW